MFYLYIIRSLIYKNKIYVGFITDLQNRLDAHNSSDCIHTSKYKPWQIVTSVSFNNKQQELKFEKYLKSGSGRAFALKRFL